MKRTLILASLALGTALLAVPTFAATVTHRQFHQQTRIAQGVNSGQLTARETSHLETREATLQHEKAAMRAGDGGALTNGDRRVLERQENRLSRSIYVQKHD